MTGGWLNGARYLDVGWEDLKKASRSYKSDPRFNQFAFRAIAERTLGKDADTSVQPIAANTMTWLAYFWLKCRQLWSFIRAKAKVKLGMSLMIGLLLLILLTRPLFYTVMAKTVPLGIRVALRRSIGLVVLIVDAILDEAATALEASLLTPPQMPDNFQRVPQYELQPPRTFYEFFWHGLFTVLGVIIGHRLPRAARFDRNAPPNRLRVV